MGCRFKQRILKIENQMREKHLRKCSTQVTESRNHACAYTEPSFLTSSIFGKGLYSVCYQSRNRNVSSTTDPLI